MSVKSNVCVKDTKELNKSVLARDELGPTLQFISKTDDESGKVARVTAQLSDGTTLTSENLSEAFKKTIGTAETNYGLSILSHVAKGMQGDELKRLTHAASMLPVFRPQDETEAMLAGQFLSLQEAGNRYLRLAGIQDGFYHLEKYTILANKLFNTANQTMQTLIKYRSRGQQTVQVIHFHNEGQAIVAQNLSHPTSGEGIKKKFED